jgi:hypothetical protein
MVKDYKDYSSCQLKVLGTLGKYFFACERANQLTRRHDDKTTVQESLARAHTFSFFFLFASVRLLFFTSLSLFLCSLLSTGFVFVFVCFFLGLFVACDRFEGAIPITVFTNSNDGWGGLQRQCLDFGERMV